MPDDWDYDVLVEAGERRERFSLPKSPASAGIYLAARVDKQWFDEMAAMYGRHYFRGGNDTLREPND